MEAYKQACESWLREAEAKITAGQFGHHDLDTLRTRLYPLFAQEEPRRRQRLMYLHAKEPAIHAEVIGMAMHEPRRDPREYVGERVQWPYATVHEAILDGWQVIHFPNQIAPFDDREVDMVGFEFICQKWSYTDDESAVSSG